MPLRRRSMVSAGAVFFCRNRVRRSPATACWFQAAPLPFCHAGCRDVLQIRHAVRFPRRQNHASGELRRAVPAVASRCISRCSVVSCGILFVLTPSSKNLLAGFSAHGLPCIRREAAVRRARLIVLREVRRVRVRACGCLIIFLTALAWGAYRWPGQAARRESRPSEGWRRTVDGWERQSWWEAAPPPFRPAMHPAAMLLIACLASLGGGLAYAPAAGPAAAGPLYLRRDRDFFVRKRVRVRTINSKATSARRGNVPSALVAERLRRPHENRTCD